ncbi:phenylalanine--tRNA ligase [Malassezia cuniculi]|uniref:Phenylalanine--tRNA ligase, mitochondrial n=1 Tax=Malassezia cuniculi TaxID=948313 RepID=A0AAF0ET31_9BASI|nr:phenylalanine--tRNA ligase [Malassezia cuniculi]
MLGLYGRQAATQLACAAKTAAPAYAACRSFAHAAACLSRGAAPKVDSLEINGTTFKADDYTNIPASILQRVHPSPKLPYTEGHPLEILRTEIERILGPKYAAIRAPSPVVTKELNFDELGFPEDHPGRQPTDTYYVNRDICLRTHTSAHEVETFRSGILRWLLTADVFRRDEIDASHYPVFHQMEGASVWTPEELRAGGPVEAECIAMEEHLAASNIVIEDNVALEEAGGWQKVHEPLKDEAALALRHLKATLNTLVLGLFGPRAAASAADGPLQVRWISAYFPFTLPSFEVEVMFGGKWLEILGTGVVHQRTLDNSGIPDKLGWAFGLGLERIAMVLFSIPDIRLFWSEDPRFISQFRDTPRDKSSLVTFRPYSRYPACYKDVSFWLNESFHENDLFETIRDTAGDLVEDVVCIDDFVHPRTKRHSRCYRVNYRSMDMSLENEQVNALHAKVLARMQSDFGLEILVAYIAIVLSANFSQPHRYGLAEQQARNLYIESDGLKIGTWHHLPDSVYRRYEEAVKNGETIPESVYEEALATYPTFVYLHGNALNRAANIRTETYKILSKSQDANVFAIDYRGFGDSEGYPTEEGVVRDARAAVEYVIERARGENGSGPGLALIGQSLGTGIAAQAAQKLYEDGIHVDAVVLLAAFTSLRPLVTEFRAGGIIPLLGWLNYLPYSSQLIDDLLAIRFDTESVVRSMMEKVRDNAELKPPMIIVMHAADDTVIRVEHSHDLFYAAHETMAVGTPDTLYMEWSSTGSPGLFKTVMHRSHPKPGSAGRIPGARVVLPRGAPFNFVELKSGGHDRLLEGNTDLIKIMLPTRLASEYAGSAQVLP